MLVLLHKVVVPQVILLVLCAQHATTTRTTHQVYATALAKTTISTWFAPVSPLGNARHIHVRRDTCNG